MKVTENFFLFVIWSLLFLSNIKIYSCCYNQVPVTTLSGFSSPGQIAINSDGCLAVADGENNRVAIYQNNGDCTYSFVMYITNGINNPAYVAFSADGSCLAVGNLGTGSDGSVTFYPRVSDCTYLDDAPSFTISSILPTSVSFSSGADTCFVVTSVGPEDNVSIYQPAGDCVYALNRNFTLGAPASAAFSSDGLCLAVADEANNTVIIYSKSEGCSYDESQIINTGLLRPIAIEFSPNGCLTVVNNGEEEQNTGSINFYSRTESCNYSFAGSISGIDSPLNVAFTISGNCMAVGNQNDEVRIYEQIDTCQYNPIPSSILTTNVAIPTSIKFSAENCLLVSNQGTGTVEIYQPSDLAVVITPSELTLCSNENIILTANPSGGTEPYTFSWEGPGGFTSNEQMIIRPALANGGMYTVQITDSTGCQATNTAEVSVNEGPVVTINPPTLGICQGQDIQLTANVFGGTIPILFSWEGPNDFVSELQTINIPNATPEENSGSYTVTVTDSAEPPCQATDTASVTVNPNPIVSIVPESPVVCSGKDITLTANPSGGSEIYTNFVWTGPNGPICSGGLECRSITISNASSADIGIYNVVVTDSNGCTGQTSTSVNVSPTPSVTIDPSSLVICAGQDIELTANPSGGSGIYTSYSWTGPTGFVSNLQTINIPDATQLNAGIYRVTVTDSNGCQGTTQSIVIVGIIHTSDARFTTCVNQGITFFPRTLFQNARAFFVPQPNTFELRDIANSIFEPVLQSLTAELVLRPSFGKLILNNNGSFTYIPDFNFIGQDSFTYKIVSNETCLLESTGTVIIQVNQCCSV